MSAAKRPSLAKIASDAYDMTHIVRAKRFTAHIRKSPFEKYTVEAATLPEAREAACSLNTKYGQFGRRAMVYAVTPDGLTFVVPNGYEVAV